MSLCLGDLGRLIGRNREPGREDPSRPLWLGWRPAIRDRSGVRTFGARWAAALAQTGLVGSSILSYGRGDCGDGTLKNGQPRADSRPPENADPEPLTAPLGGVK